MRLLVIELAAEQTTVPALARFYGDDLGFSTHGTDSRLDVRIGATRLRFRPVAGRRPFYHFAVRVPGNRFEAAREWLEGSAELLSERGSTETTFDFPSWSAVACYAHDPCGNILEVIAHRELPERGPEGEPFTGGEVLGVSELGLVGPDTRAMASALAALGLRLWDGTVDVPGRLAFVGGADGTLILAPAGRGWMPTDRPAEKHEVSVDVEGERDAAVAVPRTRHRVRTLRRADASSPAGRDDA